MDSVVFNAEAYPCASPVKQEVDGIVIYHGFFFFFLCFVNDHCGTRIYNFPLIHLGYIDSNRI